MGMHRWRCRNPFYSGLLFDSEEARAIRTLSESAVAIPSIQVCCLIPMIFMSGHLFVILCRNPFYSGLLFDSQTEEIAELQSMEGRNPFYSGLLFDSSQANVVLLGHIHLSRNPFYSGLLFDSFHKLKPVTTQPKGRNPFYSGLLFDSNSYYSALIKSGVESQSLLFRSAV